MKNTKRLLSAVLVLAVLMGVTLTASGASLAESYSDMAARAQFEALSRAQADAVEAASVLYSSFYTDEGRVFPDDYGGRYIENKVLHICIVDLDHADLTHYKTLLEGFEDVIVFENVQYSYRTLLDTGDEIADQLVDAGISVVSCGPDVNRNAVKIGIQQDSFEKMNLCVLQDSDDCYVFRENPFDVPVIFSVSEPAYPCTATAATVLVGG